MLLKAEGESGKRDCVLRMGPLYRPLPPAPPDGGPHSARLPTRYSPLKRFHLHSPPRGNAGPRRPCAPSPRGFVIQPTVRPLEWSNHWRLRDKEILKVMSNWDSVITAKYFLQSELHLLFSILHSLFYFSYELWLWKREKGWRRCMKKHYGAWKFASFLVNILLFNQLGPVFLLPVFLACNPPSTPAPSNGRPCSQGMCGRRRRITQWPRAAITL